MKETLFQDRRKKKKKEGMTSHGADFEIESPWDIIITRQAKAPSNAKRHTFIPAVASQTFCSVPSFFQLVFLLGDNKTYTLFDLCENIRHDEINYTLRV